MYLLNIKNKSNRLKDSSSIPTGTNISYWMKHSICSVCDVGTYIVIATMYNIAIFSLFFTQVS